MAELYCRSTYVVVALVEENDWGKEDLLLAAESARWMAANLERLALEAATATPYLSPTPREPSIKVECIVSSGKPLVRWIFGWRSRELYLTAPHAMSLARLTRLAAECAERKAKWLELREPAALLR